MSERDVEGRAVLAVDAGNTTTRFGAAAGGALFATWDISTPARLTADEALAALDGFLHAIERGLARGAGGVTARPAGGVRFADGIVSSVVPAHTDVWVEALARFTGRRSLVVGPGLKTGLKMTYRDPAEVGADRIADMVAAKVTYGAPVVVVDLGTTTNFEVLDAAGAFAGGIIAPGLWLSADALSRAAARLPMVEVKAPASVVGRSTREAMQSGIVLGEIARIDGLLDMVFGEMGAPAPVVLCGRDAESVTALMRHEATVDQTLTLRGLVQLHAMNRR